MPTLPLKKVCQEKPNYFNLQNKCLMTPGLLQHSSYYHFLFPLGTHCYCTFCCPLK